MSANRRAPIAAHMNRAMRDKSATDESTCALADSGAHRHSPIHPQDCAWRVIVKQEHLLDGVCAGSVVGMPESTVCARMRWFGWALNFFIAQGILESLRDVPSGS